MPRLLSIHLAILVHASCGECDIFNQSPRTHLRTLFFYFLTKMQFRLYLFCQNFSFSLETALSTIYFSYRCLFLLKSQKEIAGFPALCKTEYMGHNNDSMQGAFFFCNTPFSKSDMVHTIQALSTYGGAMKKQDYLKWDEYFMLFRSATTGTPEAITHSDRYVQAAPSKPLSGCSIPLYNARLPPSGRQPPFFNPYLVLPGNLAVFRLPRRCHRPPTSPFPSI